jgi:hypothetical protein
MSEPPQTACRPLGRAKHRIRQFLARIGDAAADESGSILPYAAVFMLVATGAGALAVDYGRLTVLRAQMQDRADAGATAAAAQLDGLPGARSRATQVATSAINQRSGIPENGSELSVQGVTFFSAISPDRVGAVGDEDSGFVQVTLQPKRVDFTFASLLPDHAPRTQTIEARAVARPMPFICHTPPLMLCDPAEQGGIDLSNSTNAGKLIRLKSPPGGGSWAPGNFGLLALPDGSKGASAISAALDAVEPQDCYSLDVTTATGQKTNQIKDGINVRFDIPAGTANPAPNVIAYPRDNGMTETSASSFGDGSWDLSAYWTGRHGGTSPAELSGASRWQVYLYELGETFARNGKQTVWPVPETLPPGFGTVVPPGRNVPVSTLKPNDPAYDGRPQQAPASNGPARRLVQAAVLQCVANNVRGSHAYPTNGRFAEFFITEPIGDGGLWGEFQRLLTPGNSPKFHANVRLVQ